MSRLQLRKDRQVSLPPPTHQPPGCFLQTAIRKATKMKTSCHNLEAGSGPGCTVNPPPPCRHPLCSHLLLRKLGQRGTGRGSSSLLRHLTPPSLIRVFPENKAVARAEGGGRRQLSAEFPSSSLQQVPPPPKQDPVSLSPTPPPPAILSTQTIRTTNARRVAGQGARPRRQEDRRSGGKVWEQERDIGGHGENVGFADGLSTWEKTQEIGRQSAGTGVRSECRGH